MKVRALKWFRDVVKDNKRNMTGVSRLPLFIMAYINECRGIEKLCVPAMIGSSVLSLPSGAKALERLFSSHFY